MRKRHAKVLGLSVLLTAGLMAVSASPSQAKWSLIKNKESVSSLSLSLSLLASELLVPELGVTIDCSGGSGSGTLELSPGFETLYLSTALILTGCKELSYGEVCEVYGEGFKSGEIVAKKAEGIVEPYEIIDVKSIVGSAGVSNVEFSGEECPFNELNFPVSGTMNMVILTALSSEVVSHTVHLEDFFLYFGESDLIMHSAASSRVLGSLQEASSEPWKVVYKE